MTDQAFLVNPVAQTQRETTTTKAAASPAFTKSPGAYRTISEASDELGVPQHVLRFWETKFSQIRPMKRSGGRRFYRPEDIDLIRTIQTLLYDQGYTIKGVQRLLKLRRGLQGAHAAVGAAMDAIEDAPTPLFDATPPEPFTVKPIIERAEQEVRAAAAEVLEQLTDELAELADAAEGDAQAAYDLFTNTPSHVLEQIPDHLPAKPARLMATGLAAGHPLPTTLAAELADAIAAQQPQPAAPQATSSIAAPALSDQQRQQLSGLLDELKALKTLLN